MAAKVKLIIGNWKMNGTNAGINRFLQTFKDKNLPPGLTVGLALPFPYLATASAALKSLRWCAAAQDVSRFNGSGAYTGEVSAAMLEDAGVTFALVGHSERRLYFNDDDDGIRAKLANLLAENIVPILCVGESLSEHQSGNTPAVLKKQLAVLTGLKFSRLAIAYEPLWAIGSGVTPAIAAIEECAALVCGQILSTVSETVRIHFLYGGSVNGANARLLAAAERVDGFLVGGASLAAAEFDAVIQAFSN